MSTFFKEPIPKESVSQDDKETPELFSNDPKLDRDVLRYEATNPRHFACDDVFRHFDNTNVLDIQEVDDASPVKKMFVNPLHG